ncbi:hypothetical protein T11_1298 [Trichinella zimbabwensis]|uniref:MULE transposase domain-containing protein n=1 Tax=Trichinella zimbabwensis TaxID=268475 RepID=A0A0V1H4I6_9BILA|nr:hypothetical protein T11_1298 [Trichinella zimbabwensis]
MVGVSIRLNYTFVWTIGARAYSSTGPTRPFTALSHQQQASFYFINWYAAPCTRTGQNACPIFLNIIRIRKFLINLRHQNLRKTSWYAKVHRSTFWCLRRFPNLDCWQPGKPRAWMVHSRLYLNGISSFSPSMPLWPVSWCQQPIVDLNPDSIICDFETALIPVIRGYFPNTRVRGCYFQFCQEVHRKVSELGLRKKPVVRYRSDEETKRKIKMLLTTAFLPVPQVVTGVRLLETGTTGNLLDLFHYFQQGWMTDDILPLWNVHNVRIRTNNHLERWHNELNKKAGKSHVRFYELLHLLIVEQGVVETLINQLLSRDPATGCLRRLNQTYAAMQRQVMIHTGECTSGRRSLEQYLEALMYLTPELI